MQRCGLKTGWAILFASTTAVFAAMTIGFGWSNDWYPAALCAVLALPWPMVLRRYLAFDAENLEVRAGFRVRRLAFAHVRGRRTLRLQYGITETQLFPDLPGEKPLAISNTLRVPPELAERIARIPDLDLSDAQEENARLVAAHGEAKLARARKVSKVLTAAACAVGLWAIFRPEPYRLAVLANLAVTAAAYVVLLRGGGVYAVSRSRGELRPDLSMPITMPGWVLTLRTILDVHLLSYRHAVSVGLAGGLLLAAFLLWSDPAQRRAGRFAALLLLQGPLAYGGALYANVMLDHGAPRVFTATVLAKSISRNQVTTYDLQLSTWGPQEQPESSSVSRAFFARVKPGDEVRVDLNPGRLGIEWFTIGPP